MILKITVLIAGLVFFIDLTSLTIMWVKNINLLQDIKRLLTNEQEEKEIKETMDKVMKDIYPEEEIEVL